MTSGTALRIREQQILNRLAREFRLDEAQLRQRLEEQRRRKTTSSMRDNKDADVSAKLTLEPAERELFELLLQQPEAIASVLESIEAVHLRSAAARALHELMTQIAKRGDVPELSALLLHTDEPAMKSLLVELDEGGHRKADVDRELALRELLQTLTKRQTEETLRQQQASLESEHLNDEQKMEMLLKMLRTKQELIDN